MLRPDQPLGLPPGSVRSILALAVLGGYFAGWVDESILTLVLGAYFVDRVAKNSGEGSNGPE